MIRLALISVRSWWPRGARPRTRIAQALLLTPVAIACVLPPLLCASATAASRVILVVHVGLATLWGVRRRGTRLGILAGGLAVAMASRAELLGPPRIPWLGGELPSPRWSPGMPYWSEVLLGQAHLGPFFLMTCVLGLAARTRRAAPSSEALLLAAAIVLFSLLGAIGGTTALLSLVVVPLSLVLARSLLRLGLLARCEFLPGVVLATVPAFAAIFLQRSGDIEMLATRVPMKVAETLPFVLALAIGACNLRSGAVRRAAAWASVAILVAAALTGLEARP